MAKSVYAQIEITLDTTESCANDTILVPINVYQFDSIGSITIFINYDTNVIEYLNHENHHPFVNGILSNAMRSGPGNTGPLIGKIGISWAAGMGPVSPGNAKLLDLKCHFINDSCDLTFDPNCEITNYQADPLAVGYVDAEIKEIPPPSISTQPHDTAVIEGNNALFVIITAGITTYQWQVDSNGNWYDLQDNATYSGVTTDSLAISNCQLAISNYRFRCKLSGCIDIYSNKVILIVSPASSISHISNNEYPVKCYPNPFNDRCTVNYNLQESSTVKLSCYNSLGELVFEIPDQHQPPGRHQILINTIDLGYQKGFYFYRIEINDNTTSGKLILQ